MILSRLRLVVAVVVVLGALVAIWFLLRPQPDPQRELPTLPQRYSVGACEMIIFEGSRFTVCHYRRGFDRIEMVLGPRSLRALETELGPRTTDLRFAMNAGMYNEDGQPVGLFIADGRRVTALNRREGPGNFHMQPNGVFTVDREGRVAVETSEAWRPSTETAFATQSGPMLVIDGHFHPALALEGQSRNVRNGVGVVDEDTAWFAISDEPVSFGKFARLFRDRLGCANALFLDGSVASLWDRPAGRRDPYPALGPIVAVFGPNSQPPPRSVSTSDSSWPDNGFAPAMPSNAVVPAPRPGRGR